MTAQNTKFQIKDLDKGRSQLMAGAVVLLLILGALFALWETKQTDREMRTDLLQRTQLIAQTINIDRVKELSGTESDLSNPSYQRVKKQLADVCSTNPQCRFLYLMGRKSDGTIFFFVDSEPADSKDYSPPGQVYTEVSDGFRNVFARHTASVVGPTTDRWGTWVTGLVPIHNPQTVMSGLATPDDARTLVRKAADYYRANGRTLFLKEVNNPQGEFRKGDLYAFVYDSSMTMLAHPVKPELVGQNQLNQKDWDGGKFFRNEIKEIALSKGTGWVDYEYENPANKQRDPKTTYFERVNDLIICAGAYKGTGAPLAVLGMDINSSKWSRDLATTMLPSVLLVLTLVAIMIIGMRLFIRRSQSTQAQLRWMQHLETGLVIVVGGTLTLFAAWMAQEHETLNRNEAFEQLAASRTELIASTLNTLRDKELEGLAHYYAGSQDVTPDEFREFATYLTKNPAVSAWEWIPVVPTADKERFESSSTSAGLNGFKIWQKDAQGKRAPVSSREVYYPISQVAPMEGNEPALGYDIGSAPQPIEALSEASQTGLATATAPLLLVQDTKNKKGMVVYLPVFASDGSKRLRGFVAAVLRMDDFLGHTGQDEPVFLELSLLRKDAAPESLAISWDSEHPPATGLYLTRPVLAFGKVFGVTAHAGPEFMKRHPLRARWLTTLIGLVITGAFAFVTKATLLRHEELERLVAKRTLELRGSEERFRALHDASFGGIAIHDHGVIFDCNQGLSDLTGYTNEELIGMDGLMLIAPDWRDLVLGNIQRDIKQTYEAEGLRKDGSKYHLSLRGNNMPYKGRIVRVTEFRDINERKLAEEKNAKLEAKLQQTHKMELVGQLAGGVAHDFNNMLTVILGNAELAMTKMASDAPCFHRLIEIRDAAQRSADITQQLLAFARKQTVAPKVLNLNDTLEGMLNMLRRLIGENIELVWLPGPNLWPVNVDPSQIDQILANLCVNARSAIEGVGKITVETANSTFDKEYCIAHEGFVPGEYARIAVCDNGCGMDKLTMAHIFEPFFTTKGVGEGTGLGLATVYGAVKQNNGFIDVYSKLGKGTTFSIYLPRHRGETGLAKIEGELEPALLGHETILLVEDDLSILEMATASLQHLGYTVLPVSTPGEAIRMINEFTGDISLVTTDVIMPEMNGRELVQRLLTIQPKMKILFMSGYAANILGSQGMLNDCPFFIQKPFSLKKLAVKVRTVLDSDEEERGYENR